MLGTHSRRRHFLLTSTLISIALVAILYYMNYDASRLSVRFNNLKYFQQPNQTEEACGCRCKKPTSLSKPETFHAIGTDRNRLGRHCILAFSAYFDDRNKTVKIVADSDLSCYKPEKIECRLWYRDYVDSYISTLTVAYITTTMPGETPRLGVVYSCDSCSRVNDGLYAVSFHGAGEDDCGSNRSTVVLPVGYTRSVEPQYKFAVCVPPLFGDVGPLKLIEFVEMHRLLGASLFIFYNESVSLNCAPILGQYSRMGVARVVQWQSVYGDQILYHNQQIMQADCMYRNLYQAKYVAQMDFDEVLLTRNATDWHGLVSREERTDTATFMFLNRFFSVNTSAQCRNDVPKDAHGIGSNLTSTYFKRLQYYNASFGPNDRSKIIYRPYRLREVCTHHAVPLAGYQTLVLDSSIATLNHYRSTNLIFVTSSSVKVENTMCTYYEALQKRIYDFDLKLEVEGFI